MNCLILLIIELRADSPKNKSVDPNLKTIPLLSQARAEVQKEEFRSLICVVRKQVLQCRPSPRRSFLGARECYTASLSLRSFSQQGSGPGRGTRGSLPPKRNPTQKGVEGENIWGCTQGWRLLQRPYTSARMELSLQNTQRKFLPPRNLKQGGE